MTPIPNEILVTKFDPKETSPEILYNPPLFHLFKFNTNVEIYINNAKCCTFTPLN